MKEYFSLSLGDDLYVTQTKERAIELINQYHKTSYTIDDVTEESSMAPSDWFELGGNKEHMFVENASNVELKNGQKVYICTGLDTYAITPDLKMMSKYISADDKEHFMSISDEERFDYYDVDIATVML